MRLQSLKWMENFHIRKYSRLYSPDVVSRAGGGVDSTDDV